MRSQVVVPLRRGHSAGGCNLAALRTLYRENDLLQVVERRYKQDVSRLVL